MLNQTLVSDRDSGRGPISLANLEMTDAPHNNALRRRLKTFFLSIEQVYQNIGIQAAARECCRKPSFATASGFAELVFLTFVVETMNMENRRAGRSRMEHFRDVVVA